MNAIPFPRTHRAATAPAPKAGGEVYIDPSDRYGGSWSVTHVSSSGDTAALLHDGILSFDRAVAAAQASAAELNASFREGELPLPGGAV